VYKYSLSLLCRSRRTQHRFLQDQSSSLGFDYYTSNMRFSAIIIAAIVAIGAEATCVVSQSPIRSFTQV
jgi:hypothetical protein